MRGRLPIILLLVVVVVVGVIAFVLVGNPPTPTDNPTQDPNQPTQPPVVLETPLPTPTQIPYVEIVIAVQEIPRGVIIAPNMIGLVPWPEAVAPVQAISSLEEVLGQVARTDIYREQPVLSSMIVPDLSKLVLSDNRYSIGSDAAAVIPANRVAVALPMNRLSSVAYAIESGDHVDVIVSFLFVDVDREFQAAEPNSFQPYFPSQITEGPTGNVTRFEPVGAPFRGEFSTRILPDGSTVMGATIPSEPPRPRLATQRTVTDALVVWTGDFPVDGRMFAPVPTPTPIPPTAVPGEEAPTPVGPPTATPLPPAPIL
jgi:pilus assembly protein CpaB